MANGRAIEHGHAPAAADVPLADRVPTHTKFFFGLGAAAETMGLAVIGGFAQFYYNQILGMSATLAGLAISLGLVLDAISDPMMGSISDRTRSRLGRRHPYMLAACVPLAGSLYAVYHPPEGLPEWWLFVWFSVFVISVRTFLTLFAVPRLALGGELSSHYTERSAVMSYNTFFGWIGAAATTWIALSYFFHATPEHPNGMLNPAAYPSMAIGAACAVLAMTFLCGWFTRDRGAAAAQRHESALSAQGNTDTRRVQFGLGEFLGDMRSAFSNRNYVVLLLAFFFLSCMLGMRAGMNIYVQNYFWEFKPEQIRMYVIGSFVGYITAFRFTTWLHRRFDKRNVIVAGALALTVFPALPIFARLAGLLPGNEWPYLLPLLVGWSVLGAWGGAAANISVMSALADIADENELRFGKRQEGVIYATRSFFAKVDDAIGHVLAGVAIDFVGFPRKAIPGQVDEDVIWWLGFVDSGIAFVPGLIAVAFYSMYRIDARKHAEMHEALARRRTAPAGD